MKGYFHSDKGRYVLLKIRLMGRTNDIKWYRKLLDRNKGIRVIHHSEILPLGNTKRYHRAYSQVERVNK